MAAPSQILPFARWAHGHLLTRSRGSSEPAASLLMCLPPDENVMYKWRTALTGHDYRPCGEGWTSTSSMLCSRLAKLRGGPGLCCGLSNVTLYLKYAPGTGDVQAFR